MIAKWRRDGALMILAGLLLAGCASAPARADSAAASSQAAAPAETTPSPSLAPPIAAPSQPPSDAQAAFLDGYRAYQSHDNARAIDRLKFAADNFPALGDYALFYLALAERDQADLNASADTLDRLARSYPDSVMIDRSEMILADNLLKLGRVAEASAVASRLIARTPEASIEQRARITEARALIALGNPKSAYADAMELRDKYPRSDSDAEARTIAHSLLASNPELADTRSLAYHRDESELTAARGRFVRGRGAGERGAGDGDGAIGSRATAVGDRASAESGTRPRQARDPRLSADCAPRTGRAGRA